MDDDWIAHAVDLALGYQDARASKLQKLGQAPGEPVPPDEEPLASAGPGTSPPAPATPTRSASTAQI